MLVLGRCEDAGKMIADGRLDISQLHRSSSGYASNEDQPTQMRLVLKDRKFLSL
jgi:hypothetical protein